jgi:hypothetical protein
MCKFRGSHLLVVALTAAFLGCASSTYTNPSMASMSTDPRVALSQALRKLWSDHVVWTRLYIIAAANGTPDAQPAADRLLKNQEELGNAIVPYYGTAAGNKLADLLKQHILIAVDLVTAAKANDQAKYKDADQRWHANAADIATFLSGANPNWDRQALLNMLNDHLSLTTREAVDRLQQNYNDDVAAFDAIFNQAMMMADALSSGIIKQFPGKFA